jgi:hypothetical protein
MAVLKQFLCPAQGADATSHSPSEASVDSADLTFDVQESASNAVLRVDIDPAELGRIRSTLLEEWSVVLAGMVIPDVQQFAVKIIQFGRDHALEDVVEWGRSLMDSASSFQIEALVSHLQTFSRLAQRLQANVA